MGEVSDPVDLVVIGGGPGGYVAALHAANAGRKVTVIERDRLGGTCLHTGCIPSKMLLDLADVGSRAQALGLLGATWPPDSLLAFQDRKRHVVDGLADGIRNLLDARGVNTRTGVARFTARSRIAVESPEGGVSFLEFKSAVVATGSRPIALDGLPFDGTTVIDAAGSLDLRHVPANLCIVGGGYVGVEMATAFAKLGAKVTVAEVGERLLPSLSPSLSAVVQRGLERLGVDVRLGFEVVGAEDGSAVLVSPDGIKCVVRADRIIVAVGREPNTDDLGLRAAGVTLDAMGRVRVGADRVAAGTAIAAIGDVVEGPPVAHKATAEAEVAVAALCGRRTAFEPAAIPLVVFSDPEVASAGHDRQSAAAAGLDVSVATVSMAALGRPRVSGDRLGSCELVVDRDRGIVVGAQIAGRHASEMIAEVVLAIEMGASPEDLALTIHAHPTFSEAVAEAAAIAVGRPVHAFPGVS